MALSNLSLLSHHLGDDEAAREFGQQALLIAQEIGDRHVQGRALTRLGQALAGAPGPGCRSLSASHEPATGTVRA